MSKALIGAAWSMFETANKRANELEARVEELEKERERVLAVLHAEAESALLECYADGVLYAIGVIEGQRT